ncbi:RHS repeat-associated core domain-containing protein [Desnuesiella massiliensis]|uniref:RHS repeat-associated core domain-containing protein n=1 Tax=Desnuesiella massiliensis TaxID=1650662 RepID=UPI0009E995BD|nr:RHS repeat-associated core domain-containing protein [Desnuesiella massiliensis]
MNLNGAEYFYVRNAQGDIIGLIDSDGVRVVSYAYDSWGTLISIKDKDGKDVTTDKTHVGYKNPYRYRGYRYDSETSLYYLQSRYYNPEWGRFINADNLGGRIGELLSHNAFAYCGNNPVNREDPSGQLWQIVGAVIGAVAGAVIAGAYTDWDWKYMLAGAAAGALVGAGVGYLAEVAYTAVAAGSVAAASATGAYNPGYSSSVGNGLGKLAGKAINVSEKGLNIVKNHISRFGNVPENNSMINRLETAMAKGNKITGADASFYMHELAESTLMKNGMQYDVAHAASLQKYGVSPFSVYHPDVIRLMPEVFNSAWRNFWGIK